MKEIIRKRYLIFVASLLVLFIGVTFVTYARQIWQSEENTTFDTTIGDIAGVKFISGDSVNVSGLGPVLDYRDSANVGFGIYNRTSGTINVSISLNITSISSSLQSSSFKWVVERLNTDEVNANNVDTVSLADLWLQELKKGCKKTRDMFGIDIDVDYRFKEVKDIVTDTHDNADIVTMKSAKGGAA